MIVAKWKEGFGSLHGNADPQKVASEIIAIGDSATPDEIVNAARDESTELHKCFEWDNDVAADKYRIIQAREVVRHLVIQEQEVPQDRPEIRIFHKPKDAEGYEHVRHIVRNDDSYDNLLKQAWAELQAFKRKYSCLKELQEILDLID